MVLGGLLFRLIRISEVVTLIPVIGMLVRPFDAKDLTGKRLELNLTGLVRQWIPG